MDPGEVGVNNLKLIVEVLKKMFLIEFRYLKQNMVSGPLIHFFFNYILNSEILISFQLIYIQYILLTHR